ncbi:MAG: TonB-dependent receptor protein [Bacteroidetes bacterium]|nr:TonB-dependent receptor protein [Bacteroidota bacterium]
MKKLSIFVILILTGLSLFAQATFNIRGKVLDKKNKTAIGQASIRVMNAKDSSFVTGESSNGNGVFSLTTKSGNYIVSVSFLGYTTVYKNVSPSSPSVGEIYLSEDSHLLKEAVVTGKAIEVAVKGDTVEYNADAYKTQPSAVVEDLVKKIPGAEVATDGTITINGKTIKKILVDGKEFFSDDPKVASKNLPASMVQKLQVLDRKSDMAQMTGFDDGNEETVINLQVRPGMKEGLFGNAYAGAGSKERYEGNAMVNYMKNTNQYTFLGGMNNTNNAGFTDFASTAFGNNRPPRGITFGSNNGITISKNGGFNFSSELTNKLTLGGNIRYGNTDNDVVSNSYTQTFNTAGDQYTTSKASGTNKSQNLGGNIKMDWKADSITRVIFTPSFKYNTNDNYQTSKYFTTESNLTDSINYGSMLYNADGHGIELAGQLDLSRKLTSSGRTISTTLKSGTSNLDSDGDNNSEIYYLTGSNEDVISKLTFKQKDKSNNWSGFLSYVEPLGNNNFMQLTYQYANTHSESDKTTKVADTDSIADDYTRNLKTDFQTHNVSLNYKMVRKSYNLTVGVGLEPSDLQVDLTRLHAIDNQSVSNKVVNFSPNAQFNYLWSKSKNLRLDYRGIATQPSSTQLTDGLPSGTSQTFGNTALKPSYEHRINLRMQNFNPQQGSAIMLFSRFSYLLRDFADSITLYSSGKKNTSYANVNGNLNGNARLIYNKPIFNKSLSLSSMSYLSYARSKSFINTESNISKTTNLQENLGLSYRSNLFDFSVRGNISYQNINNSLSGQTNQETFQYGGYASSTVYLPKNFSFDSDIDYTTNSGYSSEFKQNQWLWNASFSKQLFKDKSGTIRVKVYDILNQRNNIARTSSSTYIQDTFSNGISRYVILHFVYKFQMFKGGMKQTDMEFPRFGGGHGGGPR